jgi:hypothetical protein
MRKGINRMKTISIVIILGSILFLAASFSPMSSVYMEPTAEGKLTIIQSSPGGWVLKQVLYSLGALLTAGGFSAVAYRLRGSISRLHLPIIVTLLAATVFFLAYVVFRTVNPETWVQIPPPHAQFLAYTFLTQAGMLLLGIALLQSGYPRWLGWLITGSMVALFVLTMILRDMPPLAYYLLGLVVGFVLLRRKQPFQQQQSQKANDRTELKSMLEES